ncbi:MAG: hypothetical protein ACRDHC_02365 [Actinomycetota bacterium]
MTAKRVPGNRGIWRKRTPLEWALLVVSLAVTLAVVAVLVTSGLTGPRGPADLRVTVADVDEPASGGRPLEVTVTNVGGTSAVNVLVEVTVGDVTREMTLDLVAKDDTESATVVVPAEATGEPRAEVISYTNP